MLASTLSTEFCVLAGMLVLIFSACIPQVMLRISRTSAFLFATATLIIAGFLIYAEHGRATTESWFFFNHAPWVVDMHSMCLIIAGISFISWHQKSNEWFFSALASVLGALIMLASSDWLMLFFGLEIMSLPIYIMIAYNQRNGPEAALKYMVLSALMSGVLLYGVSVLYHLTGTTHITHMAPLLSSSQPQAVFALICIGLALAFKCGLAPLHSWVADVYMGTSTSCLMFISTLPKFATFMVLGRVVVDGWSGMRPTWAIISTILAISSMLIGATSALYATNIKRLLGYSSIGHVGFAFLGLVVQNEAGLQAAFIYIAIYVITLAIFISFLAILQKRANIDMQADNIEFLAHVPKSFTLVTVIVVLLSMVGIPPLAGFLGKWMIISVLIQHQYIWLAVAGAIYSVIALGYTLIIIRYALEPYSADPQPSQSVA